MTASRPMIVFLAAALLAAASAECSVGEEGEEVCRPMAVSAIQTRSRATEKASHVEEPPEEEDEFDEEEFEGLRETELLSVKSSVEGEAKQQAEVVIHGNAKVKREKVTNWIFTFPEGASDAEVERLSKNLPPGARSVDVGHPDEGGLPYFVMRGTLDQVFKELELHSWPKSTLVESDATLDLVPELPGETQLLEVERDGKKKSVPWWLDRIDDKSDAGSPYEGISYPKNGKGVHVYVVDTGIRTTHAEFEGRAVPTLDASERPRKVCRPDDTSCAADSGGHGTHCAGTVAGKTYGVAKEAIVHSVKIFKGSRCSISYFLTAMDWILHYKQMPAVVSLSLSAKLKHGGMANAVNRCSSAGIPVVVAAGNFNVDACTCTPAHVPSAITVGATESSDKKAGFSSWGKCLDIFAPGVNIMAASHRSDSAPVSKSGTSMACPMVAGAVALILGEDPNFDGKKIAERLVADSTKNKLKSLGTGSPNRMLYVGKPE